MARYVANTDQILALVDKAKMIGQRIEERIGEVEREVTGLQVHWEGDAARAHQEKHDTWHREIGEMKEALAGLEAAARAARERYIANVEHNKRMWP